MKNLREYADTDWLLTNTAVYSYRYVSYKSSVISGQLILSGSHHIAAAE
jgi:hypothetical protein